MQVYCICVCACASGCATAVSCLLSPIISLCPKGKQIVWTCNITLVGLNCISIPEDGGGGGDEAVAGLLLRSWSIVPKCLGYEKPHTLLSIALQILCSSPVHFTQVLLCADFIFAVCCLFFVFFFVFFISWNTESCARNTSALTLTPQRKGHIQFLFTQCSFLLYFGTLLLYLFSVIAMLTLHYIIYFFIFKTVFHRPSTCLLVLKEGHKPKPSMSLNICNLYMCIKEIYLFKKVFCLAVVSHWIYVNTWRTYGRYFYILKNLWIFKDI